MRIYNSFNEIDRDLKILKLKKQISEEEMRFQAFEVKKNFTSSFSVLTLVITTVGALFQKAIITKLTNVFFDLGSTKNKLD